MSTSFTLSKKESQSKVYVTECPLASDVSKRPHSIITNHHFNYGVDIFVSTLLYENTLSSLSLFNGQSAKNWQYYHATVPLGAFFKDEFLNNYIKKRNCLVLSLGDIDSEDVYCIYQGKLRLSLSKESYERVGLQGKQSQFSKSRYNVQLDLRQPNFLPGNKTFDRFLKATQLSPLQNPVQFLIYIFSSSASQDPLPPIPQFFNSTAYPQKFKVYNIQDQVQVPPLFPRTSSVRLQSTSYSTVSAKDKDAYQKEVHSEGLSHILEWVALLNLESNIVMSKNLNNNNSLSTYSVFSDDDQTSVKLTRISFEGFLTSDNIYEIFKTLVSVIPQDEFIIISVHGFEDAPVSWGSAEHGFLVGGENDYTIIITNSAKSKNILSFEVVGSNDTHC
ncbi:ribonuclease P 40kDa subunit-domain-containing protein [Lipomyces japonicus]|uniref:ribonuclease P 40kDa subunit-domain-containing protein n=1 Tax=Lipomyces japonicus TaxID=56871 RepID=UPI0034CF3B38